MADLPDYARQRPPLPVDGAVSSHDLVIADLATWRAPHLTEPAAQALAERKTYGLDKYGVVLHKDNGRQHDVDAEDEALDLAAYLRTWLDTAVANSDWYVCGVLKPIYDDVLWALVTIRLLRANNAAPSPVLKMTGPLAQIDDVKRATE